MSAQPKQSQSDSSATAASTDGAAGAGAGAEAEAGTAKRAKVSWKVNVFEDALLPRKLVLPLGTYVCPHTCL